MAQLKTKPTGDSPTALLQAIADPQLRADCLAVAEIMKQATGAEPEVWRGGLIGFGRHRYTNARGAGTDWMLVALAPRKQHLTVYVMPGFAGYDALMAGLGKCSHGQSCIHIKRLTDIHLPTLKKLIQASVKHLVRSRRADSA